MPLGAINFRLKGFMLLRIYPTMIFCSNVSFTGGNTKVRDGKMVRQVFLANSWRPESIYICKTQFTARMLIQEQKCWDLQVL